VSRLRLVSYFQLSLQLIRYKVAASMPSAAMWAGFGREHSTGLRSKDEIKEMQQVNPAPTAVGQALGAIIKKLYYNENLKI
jgi:hypothetical protein